MRENTKVKKDSVTNQGCKSRESTWQSTDSWPLGYATSTAQGFHQEALLSPKAGLDPSQLPPLTCRFHPGLLQHKPHLESLGVDTGKPREFYSPNNSLIFQLEPRVGVNYLRPHNWTLTRYWGLGPWKFLRHPSRLGCPDSPIVSLNYFPAIMAGSSPSHQCRLAWLGLSDICIFKNHICAF